MKILFQANNFVTFVHMFQWTSSEFLFYSIHYTKMFPADLVTFTEEILNGKLHFLCSEIFEPIVSTKPIKTSENDHSFYNTVLLKKPHAHILLTSTHLILKITCFQNKAKNLSHFTNFSANIILFGVRKKHLDCTTSWRPRTAFLKHFESKCMYISIYLPERNFVPNT